MFLPAVIVCHRPPTATGVTAPAMPRTLRMPSTSSSRTFAAPTAGANPSQPLVTTLGGGPSRRLSLMCVVTSENPILAVTS